MPRLVLPLLALLALPACDRADPGCYDRSEAHARIAVAFTEVPRPAEATALSGVFTVWEPGEARFAVDGGDVVGFELDLEPEAPLPDISEEAVGRVMLTGWGFQSVSNRPTEPTIHVASASTGSTLLRMGNGEWAPEGSLWSVASPRDLDTCASYEHDRGLARNKAAFITFDGQTERMLQGDRTTLDGLVVRMLSAQSNNRSHPWAPCSTADCPWEKLSWMAFDPDLTMLAPPPG